MPETTIDIRIQTLPFDPTAEQDSLRSGRADIGALVAFVGLMRDNNQGRGVSAMLLEHYPGMTERALAAISQQAAGLWEVSQVRIIHRVGWLRPTEPIVLVAVTSTHRTEAFCACEFLIDYLKTRAPFWKKEQTDAGEQWVEARYRDIEAAERWAEADRRETDTQRTS